MITPTENSLKDFRKKLKDKTGKTLTLNKEAWVNRVNPIIRGKVNYYLNPYKAVKANETYGQVSHCYLKAFSKDLHNMDSYVRQRLRVAMIHKNPTRRKGYQMTYKWGIEFFCKIGLISSNWLYYNKMYGYTIEQYVERQTKKIKEKTQKHIERLKAKGQEYYTPDRLAKMAHSHNS
jgi:hypothetical protein